MASEGWFHRRNCVFDKNLNNILFETNESGPMEDAAALINVKTTVLEAQLNGLRAGRGYVASTAEYGDSVQVHDGRWLTVRSGTEVRLPCHENSKSVSIAAKLSRELAHALAVDGLELGRQFTQAKMDALAVQNP